MTWSGGTVHTCGYAYSLGSGGHYGNIARSPDGIHLYIAYCEKSDGTNYRIAVRVSTDNGVSWGSAVTVESSIGTTDEHYVQIFCGQSGRVVVVYTDSSHYPRRSYSDDYGATWATPSTITSGARYRGAACVTKSGNVTYGHVLLGNSTSATTTIYHYYVDIDSATVIFSVDSFSVTSTAHLPISMIARMNTSNYNMENLLITYEQGTNLYYNTWTTGSPAVWGTAASLVSSVSHAMIDASSRNHKDGHLIYNSSGTGTYRTLDTQSLSLGTATGVIGSGTYLSYGNIISEDWGGNLWAFSYRFTSGSNYDIYYNKKALGGSWGTEGAVAALTQNSRFPQVCQPTFPLRGSARKGAGQHLYGAVLTFYNLGNYTVSCYYEDAFSFVPYEV